MKIYLRLRETGLYYGGEGIWKAGKSDALSFNSLLLALNVFKRDPPAGLEAVLVSEAVRGEAAVPVWCLLGTQVAGPPLTGAHTAKRRTNLVPSPVLKALSFRGAPSLYAERQHARLEGLVV